MIRLAKFLQTASRSVFFETIMPSLGCCNPFGLTWIWKNSPKTARLKLKTDENSSAFSKRYDLGKDE